MQQSTTQQPHVRNITAVNGLAVAVAGLLFAGQTAPAVTKLLQAAPLSLSTTQAGQAVQDGQAVVAAQKAYRASRTASRKERHATHAAIQEAIKAGNLQEAQRLLQGSK